MAKPTSITELRESICLLEAKQAEDARVMKEQLMTTYESLKPANLIQNTIKDFIASSDMRENLLTTAFSLIAGCFSKKAFIGSAYNPFKKILGTLIQLGITSMLSRNSDEIKSVATQVFKTVFRKKDIAA